MQIDIFYDFGIRCGMGHFKRCQTLINYLISFYSFFKPHFHPLPCDIPQKTYELVIIDSYQMPRNSYLFLEKNAKLLLCLDDFFRICYPKNSLVLSPTFAKTKQNHHFFGGEGYVLLHPAFKTPIPHNTQQKNHIFISLGGSNQNALILQILQSLNHLPFVFHILSPTFQSSSSNVLSYSSLSSDEICHLLDLCEFVICAGGGGVNEALSRRKKTIALCIANNQIRQLRAYKKTKALFIIFNPKKNLNTKLLHFFSQFFKLSPPAFSYGAKLPLLFKRMIFFLLDLKECKPFEFLSYREKKQILSIRNQKEILQMSFNPNPISLQTHLRFISNLTPYQFYFAFYENQKIIGGGSLELRSYKEAKLGIYRDKNAKGLGEKILSSLLMIAKKLDLQTLILEVLKCNQKAIIFYQNHHFQIIEEKEHYFIMQYHF